MAQQIVTLDERSLQMLREMIRREMNRSGNQGGRTHEREELTSPEVYVVRAPEGGIPANAAGNTGTGTTGLEDDVPGSAECDVYRKETDGVLRPAGFTVDVHNLSTGSIDANSLVEAKRDKFGTWYATPTAVVAGSGIEVAQRDTTLTELDTGTGLAGCSCTELGTNALDEIAVERLKFKGCSFVIENVADEGGRKTVQIATRGDSVLLTIDYIDPSCVERRLEICFVNGLFQGYTNYAI